MLYAGYAQVNEEPIQQRMQIRAAISASDRNHTVSSSITDDATASPQSRMGWSPLPLSCEGPTLRRCCPNTESTLQGQHYSGQGPESTPEQNKFCCELQG